MLLERCLACEADGEQRQWFVGPQVRLLSLVWNRSIRSRHGVDPRTRSRHRAQIQPGFASPCRLAYHRPRKRGSAPGAQRFARL